MCTDLFVVGKSSTVQMTVIFTSSSDLDVIQNNLIQDLTNLSRWFRDNKLIIDMKKGKIVILFGTGKRLNLFHVSQFTL